MEPEKLLGDIEKVVINVRNPPSGIFAAMTTVDTPLGQDNSSGLYWSIAEKLVCDFHRSDVDELMTLPGPAV